MQLVWKKEGTSNIKASVYFWRCISSRERVCIDVTAHNVLGPCVTCHVSRVPGTWSRNGEVLSQCGDRAASLSRAVLAPRAREGHPECSSTHVSSFWTQEIQGKLADNICFSYSFFRGQYYICPQLVGGLETPLLIIIWYCRIVTMHGDRAASLPARSRRGLGLQPPGASEAGLIGWRHSEAISRSSDGNRRW